MPDESGDFLDQLLVTLENRVKKRRDSGEYPPDLEEHLARHFDRIEEHRGNHVPRDLELEVARWVATSHFDPGQVPRRSRVPFGSVFHRVFGRMNARSTADAARQMSESIGQLVRVIVEEIEEADVYVRANLVSHIDALYEQVNSGLVAINVRDHQIADLEKRLADLEKQVAGGRSDIEAQH